MLIRNFRAVRSARVVALLVATPLATVLCGSAHADGRDATTSQPEIATNKTVARRVYEEGLSRGVFEVPYTPGFVGHGGGMTFTHEDGMAEARGWRMAFPDLEVKVDLILAEHDLVSVRWTARGTNTGSGNGVPATGKRADVSGTTIFRLADGAIAEEWTCGDSLGLMKQLGLLPAPAAAPAPASPSPR